MNKQILWLILLSIVCCPFIIPLTSADGNTSQQWMLPVYNETLHITNGQCVPLNSTVDISSLGWGVPYLSWYGRYENTFDPGGSTIPKYRIKQPSSVTELKKYYINPDKGHTYFCR